MAYLVTGGTGFIGSRIVRDLVREGKQVVVYDLFPYQDTFIDHLLSQEERATVKIVQGDLTDLHSLIHTVKENNAEIIIHMGYVLEPFASANPLLAIKVNCEGTANIFETARITGLRKVVWASSASVFGPNEKHPEEYIPNDATYAGRNLYAVCKSLNEMTARIYSDQFGVDTLDLRYTTGYAPAKGGRGTSGPVIGELIDSQQWGSRARYPTVMISGIGSMWTIWRGLLC